MQLTDITVEVRNKSLTRVGQVRPEDLDFEIRPFFNDVGDWSLTLPAEHAMVPALRVPGSGIVVTVGQEVFSGFTQTYTRKTTHNDPVGEFVFTGLLDDKILAQRACWPDPTNPIEGRQERSHSVFTGSCEAAMHSYVRWNMGTWALPARQQANFTQAPNLGRGKTVTKRARFVLLLELLQELGKNGNLGFRVHQEGDDLQFSVYQPVNRTSTIRLDVDNGTLSSDEVSLQAPTATHVIVGGQGEQEGRQFIEVSTSTSRSSVTQWGNRIERFLDQRHTGDWDELEEGGLEVLETEGAQILKVKALPSDDGTMEFCKDWFLGDRVTVVVEDQEYSDVVSGAVVKANSNGVMVGVLIGSNESNGDPLRKLSRRVGNLERNSSAASGLEARIAALEAALSN